jgi:hypothetical protein
MIPLQSYQILDNNKFNIPFKRKYNLNELNPLIGIREFLDESFPTINY